MLLNTIVIKFSNSLGRTYICFRQNAWHLPFDQRVSTESNHECTSVTKLYFRERDRTLQHNPSLLSLVEIPSSKVYYDANYFNTICEWKPRFCIRL